MKKNRYVFEDGFYIDAEAGIESKELTRLVRKHGYCEIYALGFFDGDCFSPPSKKQQNEAA